MFQVDTLLFNNFLGYVVINVDDIDLAKQKCFQMILAYFKDFVLVIWIYIFMVLWFLWGIKLLIIRDSDTLKDLFMFVCSPKAILWNKSKIKKKKHK